eukprot:2468010-Prymnesium_polylepis.1
MRAAQRAVLSQLEELGALSPHQRSALVRQSHRDSPGSALGRSAVLSPGLERTRRAALAQAANEEERWFVVALAYGL